MKYLILGCNGMAGHMIGMYLKEKGHLVEGFARKDFNLIDTIIGDAKNAELIADILAKGNYDTVINCIGILNKSAEMNKADAVYLNSYLPHYIAEVTDKQKTQIIHISTDCVFSGEKGNYTETDKRDGQTFYDRTKALGELEDNKNLTLRQSIVGPDLNPNGIGLLNWFLQQTKTVQGYTKAIWTGQTTLQLAKTIEKASQERITGLFNMVPERSISKYELLQLFNKYFRNGKMQIIPSEKVAVNKSLIRGKKGFDYQIPDYEEMIAELSEWIKKNSHLYPHYHF